MAVMRTRLSTGLEVPWLARCLIANLFRLLTEFEALFIPIASFVLLFRIPAGFRQRRKQDIEALRLGTFVIFLAIRLDGFGHRNLLLSFTKSPVSIGTGLLDSYITSAPNKPPIAKAISRLRLALQKRPLALHAPAVAGESAVMPHHAMARNRHRESVCRARLRHGAHRLGRTDALRNLRIAGPRPCRYRPERLPHALLEGCPTHVERHRSSPMRGASTKRTTCATVRSKSRSPEISVARGKRSARSCTSVLASSPSRIAHTPFPVAATRTVPSEQTPDANRISAWRPPARKSVGVMPKISADFS